MYTFVDTKKLLSAVLYYILLSDFYKTDDLYLWLY